MPVANKVVLQVGWSFRQLGALTKDRTYQGSFSALASTGEGDDALAVHRDLCRGLTGSWWLSSALHCGRSSDNTPLWPWDSLSRRSGRLDLINLAGHASGGSLLLLPWLGPIGVREGLGKMDGRRWPLAI